MTRELVITGPSSKAMTVVFEPFAEAFELPADYVMTVTLEDDTFDERLEVNLDDGTITFWVFGEVKQRNAPKKVVEVSPGSFSPDWRPQKKAE